MIRFNSLAPATALPLTGAARRTLLRLAARLGRAARTGLFRAGVPSTGVLCAGLLSLAILPMIPPTILPMGALSGAAMAQGSPAPAPGPTPAPAPATMGAHLGTPADPLPPEGLALDQFLWNARPLIVFAESAQDPNFHRQMQLLQQNPGDLFDRQVVVIADTDSATLSDLRRRLRPNGFAIVLIDTNGRVLLTRPTPRSVREISASIDKSPQRRQELQDRRSGG